MRSLHAVPLTAAALLTAGCATAGVGGPGTAPAPSAPTELEALPPYAVYGPGGRSTTLDDVVEAMGGVDVVFVGEEHDDSIGHVVEDRLLQKAYTRWASTGQGSPHAGADTLRHARNPRVLAVSMEMFETDVQLVLNEYLEGLITEDQFQAASRPWPNYDTDYKPLVEFAREHGVPVVAANAPRRYVNMVTRGGRAALRKLPKESLVYLPPLPYARPSAEYKAQWDSVMAEAMGQSDHQALSDNMFQAQALWDATMGWSIARALQHFEQGNPLVIHYSGSFHSARGTGTPEALHQYAPRARYMVVIMKSVKDPRVEAPGDRALGEFVVLTRAKKGDEGGG